MKYIVKNCNNIELTGELRTAQNSNVIDYRNNKINTKYHIYSKQKNIIVENESYTIFDLIELDDYVVATYSDINNKLSYVVINKKDYHRLHMIIYRYDHRLKNKIKLLMGRENLYCIGYLKPKSIKQVESVNIALGTNSDLVYKFTFLFPSFIRKVLNKLKLNKMSYFGFAKIKLVDVAKYHRCSGNINIPMYINLVDDNANNYYFQLKEKNSKVYKDQNYLWNSKNINIDESTGLYVRKSTSGQYVIVVSTKLVLGVRIKELLAFLISKFSIRKDEYVIFYEKFCEGADESAYEVFKYCHQKGEKNIRFILDKNNENFNALASIYGKHLVAKNSFKHFYYFFKAKALITSDSIPHIQKRVYDNSRQFKNKILKMKNKVFLQHGVCLATNVFKRGYFNSESPIAPDYILVSSELEKKYFIENTNYHSDQIIKLGLANMDDYVRNCASSKEDITFILTWRPWDLAGSDENNSYINRYKQFVEMIEADSFYRNKNIHIILHPKAKLLLQNQNPEIYANISKFLYNGKIKDVLLQTKVLITDYSSVAFYGFSGGSNIVFYWEDKALAEKEYGSDNILQSDNAFGDMAYSFDSLNSLIKANYVKEQQSEYIERFHKMVETDKGINTEKIYNFLKDKFMEDA